LAYEFSSGGYCMMNWKEGLVVAVTVGILALPAGLIGGGHLLEQSPSFCNSCHEMAPSYEAWIATGAAEHHPNCMDCHSGAGLAGVLESQLRGLRMIGKHFLERRDPRLSIEAEVPDYFCLKCHSKEKTVADHSMLRIEGQTCANCHNHREGWKFSARGGGELQLSKR
jgi:cytochrome c-type protein NapC